MRRKTNKFLAGFLAASCIVTSIPLNGVLAAETIENAVNYARWGTATANDTETGQESVWGPEKVIDGIVNRSAEKPQQSRWSTNLDSAIGPKVLTVDLKEERTFDKFVIEWERTNIQGFTISVSTDGQNYTDVYDKPDEANVELTTRIDLPEEKSGRYVKLTIDAYDGGEINWQSVSIYEFEIWGTKTLENLALRQTATANGYEADTVKPEKAVDGDLGSASAKSQWGSSRGEGQKWLQVDLGEAKRVGSVAIEWERKNATNYSVLTSTDGTAWNLEYRAKKAPDNYRDEINFSEVKNARYVKVQIDDFVTTGEDRYGNSVDWDTVSIVEFEVYGEALANGKYPPPNMGDAETIDDVIAALQVPEVTEDMKTWSLPEVPDGFEIEFIGADYEQIIGSDLKIYKPLTDTTVTVNYKISKDGESKDTPAYEVTVPGQNEVSENDNEKPVVIPELAEWKGNTGEFTIIEGSKVVIDEAYKDELAYIAESFPADYEEITGNEIQVTYGNEPAAGDFFFTMVDEGTGLTEEGYLMTVTDSVKVEAEAAVGAYWSTRSILQILKQTEGTIAKGVARDYPKFKVRGFMLDVGRKPFSLNYLYETIETMSWYKLNDFGIHLSDNYIWVEEYQDTDPFGAYSGFRLESDIKKGGDDGKNKADLTSTDMSYTKAEFRQFIQDARAMGIDVVPEFDAPAHSLAYTKVRPDLAMPREQSRRGRWADHFDLSKPESTEFIQRVWNEYTTGDNPVFDGETILNIGTDEYEGDGNDFRNFTNDMIEFVQGGGRTVRLWGSLTSLKGTVEVPEETADMDKIQMYMWNNGWANPTEMYKDGFNMININDGSVYIVPGANYYSDYLNAQSLYSGYEANRIGGVVIPAGSDQMLGGAYAIWNDMVDKKANGLGELDIYDRFAKAAPGIASKLWGDGEDLDATEFSEKSNEIGIAPGINPYYEVETKGETVMEYTFDNETLKDSSRNRYNAKAEEHISYAEGKEGKALRLNGNNSYATTPVENIGPDNSVSFWIKADADAEGEQIILESELGAIKAAQKETGKFGFSREEFDYSFDYTLPKDEWVYITIKGYQNTTELYVNDTLEDTITGTRGNGSPTNRFATMVLPTATIGSKEHAFKGLIDELTISVTKEIDDSASRIPTDGFTVTCDNEQKPGSDVEGTIDKAFDGNIGTIWHSSYSPHKALPATVEVDMGKAYIINQLDYVPRQSGINGNILQYRISGKLTEDAEYTLLTEGSWSSSGEMKKAYFDPTEVRYLKIEALDGASDSETKFASAAEFYIHEYDAKAELKALIAEVEEYDEKDYLAGTWEALIKALTAANAVVEKENATDEEIAKAVSDLENAIDSLVEKGSLTDLIAEAEKLVEEEYTEATWAVFKAAFDAAKKLNEETATPAEVEKAIKDLQDAMDGLKRVVNKTELETAIAEAEKLVEEEYTEATWAVFKKALDAAKAVKDNENATQEEVDAAKDALVKAQKALVKAGDDEDKPIEEIFDDVRKGDWYYEHVDWAYKNKIMTGYGNSDSFGPANTLNRAEFAKILYNYAGTPDVEFEDVLKDVKEGDWYADAVIWAYKEGIITGYTDGSKRFGATDEITREQMATILYRYAGEPEVKNNDVLKDFPDVNKVTDFAKDAMIWSVENKIITGDKGNLNPLGNANRAEAAAMMRRAFPILEKGNK